MFISQILLYFATCRYVGVPLLMCAVWCFYLLESTFYACAAYLHMCVCVLLLFPRSCLVAIMTIFGNLVLPGGCVIAFCGFCFFAAAFYLPAKVFLGAFFFSHGVFVC